MSNLGICHNLAAQNVNFISEGGFTDVKIFKTCKFQGSAANAEENREKRVLKLVKVPQRSVKKSHSQFMVT